MSMTEAYYKDFGQNESAQIARRQKRSIANQQAAFLGQQRGSRRIADITEAGIRGYNPQVSAYGRRGLSGPNVQSGITRKALADYATGLQAQLGAEQTGIQDELNRIAMDEASQQADLESYLAEQRLQKQRDIINAATQLRQFSSY
jgi:hypothetical protein